MDMNTIALIKGLAGNGGGGSSLPTNPAQDGTYALQNTVSSGTSTLSWASGSSGGVLVVTITNGTLDKTWQEIYDAMQNGVVVLQYDNPPTKALCGYATYQTKTATYDVVFANSTACATSSADGYPVMQE